MMRDYLELTKPRVVLLMLLTALIGMLLAAPEWVGVEVILLGNLGIALCAGSAAAMNHLVDWRIDARMQRTSSRPLAQGRLQWQQVAVFSAVLGVLGFAELYWLVNPLTAWLTVASLVGYACVYSLWLKHATPQNIVIGGLAGAAPPLLGWSAVTATVTAEPLLLVLIIFLWTPPHFWALAIDRREEYASVGIPMLPVVYDNKLTRLHILLYTILLLLASLLPWLIGMLGLLYLAAALVLGAIFIGYALSLYSSLANSYRVFRFSITYLLFLFVFILLDHYWLLWLP